MRQLFKRQTHHFVYSVPFNYSMNATLSVCQEKVFLPNVYKIDARRLISYPPSARAVLRIIGPRLWRSEVRTETTEGQDSSVQLELVRLVDSLSYGTRIKLVFFFNLLDFKNFKKLNELSRLSKPICYNKFFM